MNIEEGEDNEENSSLTVKKPLALMTTEKKFCLALITNSPQVRIVDESFACSPLDGHTDIVLAADVSPDG